MRTFFKYLKQICIGRNKKEAIGIWLGGICFIPTFLTTLFIIGLNHFIWGFTLFIVTQGMWLTSITLCTWSYDEENRQLKKAVKKGC